MRFLFFTFFVCLVAHADYDSYADVRAEIGAKNSNARFLGVAYSVLVEAPRQALGVNKKATVVGLSSSTLIDKDDPKIIALARSIVRRAKTQKEASELLTSWVHTSIAYDHYFLRHSDPASMIGSIFTGFDTPYIASVVLEYRLGICEGMAYLNAALHRAVRIPALAVRSSPFERHAWNAVLIQGKWVDVDPTFGTWGYTGSGFKQAGYFPY